MYKRDTIAAISTPPGTGGIAVIRVSGDNSEKIAGSVFKPAATNHGGFESHRFYFGKVVDSEERAVIDEAMVVMMFAPRSYTRENILEIHCHGGAVVAEKVLSEILKSGARLAEPGEFTKRAFLNGRIDLAQAESVIDIIEAKTEAALQLAQQQREGFFSRKVTEVAEKLRLSLALVEACIDFPEDDPGSADLSAINSSISFADTVLAQLSSSYGDGHLIRDGISALIAGKPNAGKSSLLNALLKNERAIVTHIPGTTRDIIEESININGLAVKFLDTAGIRHTDDPVEQEGISRTLARITTADIVIFLLDSSRPYSPEDDMIFNALGSEVPVIYVLSKCDLPFLIDLPDSFDNIPLLRIAARFDIGVAELLTRVRDTFLKSAGEDLRETITITRTRHRDAIDSALKIIRRLRAFKEEPLELELLAVDLREILFILGCITGETTTDDLLDLIFSSFCIGK